MKNVSKEYSLDKGITFNALKNINLSFASSGLVCIKGASGSGKSTLLNIIAAIDKPTNGNVIFNGEDIFKYKEKELNYYRNASIGMLFQNYNLIEDETVLYNIMLPCLIHGSNNKSAEHDAKELLEKINFPKEYYDKQISLLSGGEKQRVALLRSLVNSPYILLCDEPTGALDSDNSKLVMDILKKVAHRRLVILVSHNEQLINEYADRIITIKDGQVVDDITRQNEDNGTPVQKNKISRKSNISNRFAKKNLKKRLKKNLISLSALTISLTAVLLSLGFSTNASKSLLNASLKQFDLGVSTISKESKTAIEGSSLSLSQVSRIPNDELYIIKNKYQDFIFANDYSYFIPSSIEITANGDDLSSCSYSPVYSFKSPYVSSDFLISGNLPKKDSLKEVIINQSAYEYIKSVTKDEPLHKVLNLYNSISTSFFDEYGNEIKDNFTYIQKVEVVGVVQELSFLLTPKIYYSYTALHDYLAAYPLNNVSSYLGVEYSITDRVEQSSNNDVVSNYDHLVFLKDVNEYQSIQTIKNSLDKQYAFNNSSYSKYDALNQFSNAISLGLVIFLIVTIIGAVLILGIINYSSYSDDFKDSAILTSLGTRKEEISSIFINESLTIGLFSFVLSFIFAFILSKLCNWIIYSFTYFENLIIIPFKQFKGVYFSLPLLMFLGIVLISILSTYLPIMFSKKISLKKELETND